MRTLLSLCVAALAGAMLAACNDGSGGSTATMDGSTARGTLIWNPPLRIATLTATDFVAQLNAQGPTGQQLLALVSGGTNILPCGVDFHYIQYGTVDGGNPALLSPAPGSQQPTTASGALMVPTGGAGCSGARPIVLYAHGTDVDKTINMADVTNPNNTEGVLVAATFAAFGYIVVAPNFAGYDSSPLPYHPFVNGDQNSKEMIDALTAARKALGNIPAASTTDSGKLFVAGYSEGGYAAMAAHKAMQAFSLANPTNTSLKVTAAGTSSGPYALSSFGDAVFFGNVNLGGTAFGPMTVNSYQHTFGNIYTVPTDIAEAPYAANVGVLPSPTPINTLFAQGVLPQLFFFNHNPPTAADIPAGTPAPIVTALTALFPTITPPSAQFAFGFNPSPNFPTETNLIKNTFRAAYLADALLNPDGVVPTPTTGLPPAATGTTLGGTLRGAFKANDMRSWVPNVPVLLCGGHQDPTVFYSVNTQTMQAFWTPQLPVTAPLTVVDVDPAPATTAPAGTPQAVFLAAQSAVFLAAGGGAAGTQAVLQAYHGSLVPPPCTVTVRGFFNTF